MGALTIAFDTTIVGALALPWVYLFIHLFFFDGDKGLLDWFGRQNWKNTQGLPAVAGVLLFAMAFTLGSAVSRIAQDFFNDDDLRVPGIFRMTMTENRIIASVYCETDEDLVLLPAANPALADKIKTFRSQKSNCCSADESQPPAETEMQETKGQRQEARRYRTCVQPQKDAKQAAPNGPTAPPPQPCLCERIVSGTWRYSYDRQYGDAEDSLIKTARDIFGLEENALLLKGEDATQRLRQLHDQIMVLRGATFDGLLTLSLCLFGWGAKVQSERRGLIWRILLGLVPALFLFIAADAFYHHLSERAVGEPPYMEFTLSVIGLAGAWLLWIRPRMSSDKTEEHSWLHWRWAALSLVFTILFAAGVMGWWATEVLYSQQVIYSYDSQSNTAQK